MHVNIPHWLTLLALFVAGLLLPVAFAPVGWGPLAVPLLAYLFYQWQCADRPVQAWWQGWIFGCGMFVSGVYWVYISMHDYGAVPVVFSALLTLLFALFLGLFPALTGWLSVRFFSSADRVRLLLVFPAVWVLIEWVRSWFFTGFPWMNLGTSQVAWPLAGYAAIVGEYGISYLLALSAAACVYVIGATARARIITLVLFIVLWSAGQSLRQVEWTDSAGDAFKVALVQGNVDQATKWDPDYRAQIIAAYLEQSRPHWEVDVMIWPETAISAFYDDVPEITAHLDKLARDTDTDILVGIPYRDQATQDYYNSVLSIGSAHAFYHKRHLVPFGEFIPLQEQLSDVLDFMGLPMSGFSRGASTQVPLSAGGYLAGLTVCYEIIFNSEVIQSLPAANYLVNVSNNTWFGDSSMPYQQLQMAQLRALETERYVLSATNNGVSAVVDHRGRIVGRSPQFRADVLRADVQARRGATPYVIYGNYPIIIFLSVLLGMLVIRNSR